MNKTKTALSILACCAACVSGLHGQGTFGNLDFEATTIPPGTPAGSVSAADAFPSWQAYYGSSLQPVVRYNTLFLSAPNISLVDPGAGFASPLEGSYSALLQSGFDGNGFLSASLAQTGTIPAFALFLQMRVYNPLNDSFQVTVGGNTVAMIPIQTTPQYTLYSGDIASMAGLTAELRITALANAVPSASTIYLDSIRFSAVPEPSTWALLAVGSFALWLYRRRHLLRPSPTLVFDSPVQPAHVVRVMPACKPDSRTGFQWNVVARSIGSVAGAERVFPKSKTPLTRQDRAPQGTRADLSRFARHPNTFVSST